MDPFLQAAIDEAKKGLAAGGIPIGSVLVGDGKIIGRGHNQRGQHGSVIHHGEWKFYLASSLGWSSVVSSHASGKRAKTRRSVPSVSKRQPMSPLGSCVSTL